MVLSTWNVHILKIFSIMIEKRYDFSTTNSSETSSLWKSNFILAEERGYTFLRGDIMLSTQPSPVY